MVVGFVRNSRAEVYDLLIVVQIDGDKLLFAYVKREIATGNDFCERGCEFISSIIRAFVVWKDGERFCV